MTILRSKTENQLQPCAARLNTTLWICLLLAGITFVCYGPLGRHEFINFDDHDYILENPHVQAGLTWVGFVWAFTASYASNWHPLTWLSHMVDCQFYGLNPAGHHFTNLLLHIANSLLVFLVLKRATGAMWRSAFVAALFAWHPLHVESVAWAAERKDVLSTLFFLLSLMAYVGYARKRLHEFEVARQGSPPGTGPGRLKAFLASVQGVGGLYWLALLFFAFGLMSKPMLVTLPCVLFLLDYWPLQRFRLSALTAQRPVLVRLFLEKAPFFILSVGASVVTLVVQKAGDAVCPLAAISLRARLANAVMAYVRYLGKTLWPTKLSVFYPYVEHWPVVVVVAAAILLGVLSVLFVAGSRRHPYGVVGWCWFLGTLVPTIGLVQVGSQSMADRYMYIPSIGLFVLLVWLAWEAALAFRGGKAILTCAAAACLLGCLACTGAQLTYWRTDERLFRHATEVTSDNYVGYDHLGDACFAAGKSLEAMGYYRSSLRLRPQYAEGHYNLGTLLMSLGRLDEAAEHLATAIKEKPVFARAHVNLGKVLVQQGRREEALAHLVKAVELEPTWPEARYNLGTVLFQSSRVDEAVGQLQEAVRLNPEYAEAYMNLAICLMAQHRAGEALRSLAEAVRLAPANPEARYNLGLALLEQGRPGEAAAQFTAGLRLRPDQPRIHYRLAEALNRQNKSAEAVFEYRETLRLAPDFADARRELVLLESAAAGREPAKSAEAVSN